MNLVRSSLRAKLLLAFAAVSAVFLVAVAIGISGISSVGSNVQREYRKALLANVASAYAFNMRVSQAQDVLAHKLILNPDGSQMHAGDVASYAQTMAQLRKVAASPADRTALGRIDALFARWQQADAYGARLWQSGRLAQAIAWENGEANSRGDDLSNALFDYATATQKAADAAKASAVSS